jgi:hypothetical protein
MGSPPYAMPNTLVTPVAFSHAAMESCSAVASASFSAFSGVMHPPTANSRRRNDSIAGACEENTGDTEPEGLNSNVFRLNVSAIDMIRLYNHKNLFAFYHNQPRVSG